MLPIAVLRISIFMVAVLWLAIAQVVCMLIPIAIVRRPVQRILMFVGCSLALLALGVLNTSETVADYRRLKLPAPKSGGASCFDASRGSIVIVNQQGLTD